MDEGNRNQSLLPYGDGHENATPDYREETGAELSAPVRGSNDRQQEDNERGTSMFYGWASLILAVFSLYFLPVVFGLAAILLGLAARRKNAAALGVWGIGIGAVSLILGLFVYPFF
ncbi:hypothetical protein [Heyndrickxia acidiproducens]|uniref:hypothetical protein n=1 Tax=Heyndrickxia acidiproducens TaxID=1121084 RepID=UPI000382832C|nr:hypothetical protein [Heyndrickxia acidiproducens]